MADRRSQSRTLNSKSPIVGLEYTHINAVGFHALYVLFGAVSPQAERVNVKAISERLGHSNVSLTLNVYSHLLPGLQTQAAQALDKRLSE